MRKDVGLGNPLLLTKGQRVPKVALTLEEWRSFWKTHGESNDGGSTEADGMTARFDPETFLLTLSLPIDLASLGTTRHETITADYFGVPFPEDKQPIPGPIQRLTSGTNTLKVWHGLPPLARGALPSN